MGVFTDAGGAAIGEWQPKEFKSFQIAFEEDTPGWFELHTRDFDKTVAFYERGLRLDHPGRGRLATSSATRRWSWARSSTQA